MRSLSALEARTRIGARLARLDANAAPRWGTFSSAAMLAHCVDALRIAMGELPCAPINVPFVRTRLVRWLALRALPFPKNAPTAPEMIARPARDFSVERDELLALIARFAPGAGPARWSPHPLFGELTEAQWGELAFKHLDHHLRQFGL